MKTGIVDDSGFMRLVLKKIISKNSEIRVCLGCLGWNRGH